MSDRIEAFAVTVATGSTSSAPATTSLAFNPGAVERVEIEIPSGHAGTTGLQLWLAGSQILPWTVGGWIIADDDHIEWPYQDNIGTGAWQARAYNTGVFVHSFYVRFHVRELTSPADAIPLEPTPVVIG